MRDNKHSDSFPSHSSSRSRTPGSKEGTNPKDAANKGTEVCSRQTVSNSYLYRASFAKTNIHQETTEFYVHLDLDKCLKEIKAQYNKIK